MRPEEVVGSIHTAPERCETVRAALRYGGDGPIIKGRCLLKSKKPGFGRSAIVRSIIRLGEGSGEGCLDAG